MYWDYKLKHQKKKLSGLKIEGPWVHLEIFIVYLDVMTFGDNGSSTKDVHQTCVFVGHKIGRSVRIWEFYRVSFETVELEKSILVLN